MINILTHRLSKLPDDGDYPGRRITYQLRSKRKTPVGPRCAKQQTRSADKFICMYINVFMISRLVSQIYLNMNGTPVHNGYWIKTFISFTWVTYQLRSKRKTPVGPRCAKQQTRSADKFICMYINVFMISRLVSQIYRNMNGTPVHNGYWIKTFISFTWVTGQLVPESTRTQVDSYPFWSTRIPVNSYPSQLVP